MTRCFFDRNVSIRLAQMVGIFDRQNQIEHHDSYFSENTTDIEWLKAISQWNPRPVVVAGDLQILRRPSEAQVLQDSNLTFVALGRSWPRLGWEEMAWKFIKIWPKIAESVMVRHPTVFMVPISANKVEEFCRTSQLGRSNR